MADQKSYKAAVIGSRTDEPKLASGNPEVGPVPESIQLEGDI